MHGFFKCAFFLELLNDRTSQMKLFCRVSDARNLILSIFTHCAMSSASVFLALMTEAGSASLEPLQEEKEKTYI